MRIVALADIHFSGGGQDRLRRLASAAAGARPDVLVLAGDLATIGDENVEQVLAEFSRLDCAKLFVAGNHDIWTEAGAGTRQRYETTLSRIAQRLGFNYLDHSPTSVGPTGFVGCLGWYDYTLRQTEEPVPGVLLSPARPLRRSSLTHLETLSERGMLRWDELRDSDFQGKALIWTDGRRTRTLVWNDAIYVHWQASDAEVVQEQVQRLQAAVRELDGAEHLVAVTHTVPFREAFRQPYRRVEWAFCRAYMGSSRLGAALVEEPRLRLWICGHVHYQVVVECQGVIVVNVSCAPEQHNAGPTLILLDGPRVRAVEQLPVS
ncbi:MAG: metallophosphoesterase family protein [Armatimonadetes bacterium]|nr:metallophosphoesterase family protein [Armatimonadota bacterium]